MLDGEFSFPIGSTKEEREGASLLLATAYIQAAALGYENISDVLDIAGQVKGRAMPKDASLVSTALFYRHAAKANLQHFEQSVVNTRAEAEKIEFDVMKRKMMQEDQAYLITRFALDEPIKPIPTPPENKPPNTTFQRIHAELSRGWEAMNRGGAVVVETLQLSISASSSASISDSS